MTPIIDNSKITYLIGDPSSFESRPLQPYDDLLCEFLNDLSSALSSCKKSAGYSDVMSFAFWCRKSNMARLKTNFEDGRTRLGLGLIFHIAPSNVPVNFAFSLVFGLLSGNANIVKVPSRPSPQTDLICTAIKKLFESDKYHEIKTMTAIVRYEKNNVFTELFSANCNARVIWGGDETIKNIRKIPIPERSIEITFADRYSFCVIDAAAVNMLDESELRRLSDRFYNDTYLMDQQACSSPHLIVWLGDQKEAAKERFWRALYQTVIEKYELSVHHVVEKYTLFCKNAIDLDNIIKLEKCGHEIYRIAIDRLPDETDTLRGKFGYFFEFDTDNINSIAPAINAKFQTMTYFGMDKSILLNFVVKNRLSGIDRIVPIGRGLDLDVVWDGYDIVDSLSRIIEA